VRVAWTGGWIPLRRERCRIEDDTWRELGACRSPYNPEWCNNFHDAHYNRVGVQRQNGCAAGAAYEAWMEDEPGSASVMEVVEFSNATSLEHCFS
jgi:hypothetical protein